MPLSGNLYALTFLSTSLNGIFFCGSNATGLFFFPFPCFLRKKVTTPNAIVTMTTPAATKTGFWKAIRQYYKVATKCWMLRQTCMLGNSRQLQIKLTPQGKGIRLGKGKKY